jgi:hypothetical protein
MYFFLPMECECLAEEPTSPAQSILLRVVFKHTPVTEVGEPFQRHCRNDYLVALWCRSGKFTGCGLILEISPLEVAAHASWTQVRPMPHNRRQLSANTPDLTQYNISVKNTFPDYSGRVQHVQHLCLLFCISLLRKEIAPYKYKVASGVHEGK